jgi:hypothetical protein
MKGKRYVQQFLRKMNFLSRFLDDLPTPDFNVKIVFYEK